MEAEAEDGTPATAKTSLIPSCARRLMVIVHASVPIKALLFLAVVVLGSCLQASGVVPETLFSIKTNPINKYLVKFSWFWTSMWMFVTILVTSTLYTAFSLTATLRHFGRIAVGHVVWYCVTTMIVLLDNRVGECSMEIIPTAKACVRGGYEWTGFDISGHVFLLSYCIFIITEESFNIKAEIWRGVSEREATSGAYLSPQLTDLHRSVTCFAEALELFSLLLVLIWSGMLLTTSLYFHTFVEKLLGLMLSVGVWYGTYRVLYGRSQYLPSLPKAGVQHPAVPGTLGKYTKFL